MTSSHCLLRTYSVPGMGFPWTISPYLGSFLAKVILRWMAELGIKPLWLSLQALSFIYHCTCIHTNTSTLIGKSEVKKRQTYRERQRDTQRRHTNIYIYTQRAVGGREWGWELSKTDSHLRAKIIILSQPVTEFPQGSYNVKIPWKLKIPEVLYMYQLW